MGFHRGVNSGAHAQNSSQPVQRLSEFGSINYSLTRGTLYKNVVYKFQFTDEQPELNFKK